MSSNCAHCKWREKYDRNPRSVLGRIWRWHTGWCPGWKGYINSLPDEERQRIEVRYASRPRSGSQTGR